MTNQITRKEAIELLRKYNKETFHIQHALTVEGVGMPLNKDTLTSRITGESSGFYMTLTLNFIRRSIAKKHRNY